MINIQKEIERLIKRSNFVFMPPPDLRLSEWSEQERVLSRETSPFPGPWSNERVPYLIEIMDAINDPAVEMIVVVASSQVAKTEFLLNVIGYFISQDPASILFVLPTAEMAKQFSKKRIKPLIRDTPCLNRLFRDPAMSRSGNTTLMKESLNGASLILTGSKSPTALSSNPIRIALGDEVDRFANSAGTEGNPIDLLIARTSNFSNRKIIFTSTPTVTGLSKIINLFEDTDQRHYHVPCPHCNEYQKWSFDDVEWETKEDGTGKPETAVYVCVKCGSAIEERHRVEMIEKGKWVAEAEFNGNRGFRLNAMHSTFVLMKEMVKKHLKAEKGDENDKRVFDNTVKGVTYNIDFETIDEDALYARREEYEAEVPYGVGLLTAAVDVQGDRLEADVVGWGVDGECWAIEHKVCIGKPIMNAVWDELEEFLRKTFYNKGGFGFNVRSVTVDTAGHSTGDAYDFIKKTSKDRDVFEKDGKRLTPKEVTVLREMNVAVDRIFMPKLPIKGIVGRGGWDKGFVNAKPTWNAKRGCHLWTLYVDKLKEDLLFRLKVQNPGKGYVHFPNDPDKNFDSEYFEQLTAEKLTVETKEYVKIFRWRKERTRNEAIDLWAYNIAAFKILNPVNMEKWVEMTMPKDEPKPETEKEGYVRENEEYNSQVNPITGGTGWKIDGW